MNDEDIEKLAKQKEVEAILIMDDAGSFIQELDRLSEGKRFTTIIMSFFYFLATKINENESGDLVERSKVELPDLLKKYIEYYSTKDK